MGQVLAAIECNGNFKGISLVENERPVSPKIKWYEALTRVCEGRSTESDLYAVKINYPLLAAIVTAVLLLFVLLWNKLG